MAATGAGVKIPRDMEKAGFTTVETNVVVPKLMVCSQGEEKQGKTYWAFTAPPPIAVVASDTGTESVASTWRGKGKDIKMYQYRVPKGGVHTDAEYKAEWAKLEDAIMAVVDNRKQFRTLIVDTGTEVWEMKRLAMFGKLTQVMPHQYVEANKQFTNLIKTVYDAPGLNSVWIHKVKKEYKQMKGQDRDSWTGKMERAGFGDIGYLADLCITNRYDREEKQFCCDVTDSRYTPDMLIDETFFGESNSFVQLAQYAFPDTDESYWL